MKKVLGALLLLCLASTAPAQQREAQARQRAASSRGAQARQRAASSKETSLIPYKYSIDDLDNGLRLVTVPTDFPNMVALYIVVQAGSRNEIEPGKSGYAHLFEHIMFRPPGNFVLNPPRRRSTS